ALPKDGFSALESSNMYKTYFYDTSLSVMLIVILVLILAYFLIKFMKIINIDFV
ncbi:peptide transporter, partial [Francisella tularensis subsp. holarctica]|nr:peptide transporter [Francisella tularensis subsp. holarctica]